MTTADLKALPKPAYPAGYFGGVAEGAYTAEQLRAYAAAAVAQERERCARVCEDKERRKWEIILGGGRLEGFGPLDCAAAIREGM